MSKSLSLKFIFSPKFDFFQVDPDFFFILSELYEIKLRININCCDASGVCNRVPSVRDVPWVSVGAERRRRRPPLQASTATFGRRRVAAGALTFQALEPARAGNHNVLFLPFLIQINVVGKN